MLLLSKATLNGAAHLPTPFPHVLRLLCAALPCCLAPALLALDTVLISGTLLNKGGRGSRGPVAVGRLAHGSETDLSLAETYIHLPWPSDAPHRAR